MAAAAVLLLRSYLWIWTEHVRAFLPGAVFAFMGGCGSIAVRGCTVLSIYGGSTTLYAYSAAIYGCKALPFLTARRCHLWVRPCAVCGRIADTYGGWQTRSRAARPVSQPCVT
eukprot:3940799-Rhodomonas_salina.8